jgi:hypothetical protein
VSSALETALALIVRDLRSTEGITLRLSEELVDSDPAYESLWMLSEGESRTGLLAPLAMAQPERIVHIADQAQEFILEELGRLGLPAAWPECPEHPGSHPLEPTLASGGPHWVCPKSGDTVAPIGEL